MQKCKFITSSQSTGYQVILKRCLVGLQKGVSNTLKEHLLHGIRRLLEARRVCVSFELRKNIYIHRCYGNKLYVKAERHSNEQTQHEFVFLHLIL